MNGDSVVLSGQGLTAEDFYSEIISLEKALARLKEKFLKIMPVKYGSDAWWEQEAEKSRQDYKNGDYIETQNKKELHVFLSDLKK